SQSFAGLSLDRTRIMGVVNVTPDSFSDGGQFASVQDAVDCALRLEDDGADILDIGGESTRPGSDAVTVEDELRRVIPVIEKLKAATSAKISIDTRKAQVMRAAADAGADIINDVSALTFDPESLATAAGTGLPVILMHAQGDPKTMQKNPQYDDVVREVMEYLASRIEICSAARILKESIAIDPGIGFGKTGDHNLALIAALDQLQALGSPVLLGASRKRFIGTLGNEPAAANRAPGSIAAALAGVARGVRLLRVHDVRETRQALSVWEAVERGAMDVDAG
ncbi:MAG: dihydropteroate synthase, partial [Hyphomicrobiaceae bacterium]